MLKSSSHLRNIIIACSITTGVLACTATEPTSTEVVYPNLTNSSEGYPLRGGEYGPMATLDAYPPLPTATKAEQTHAPTNSGPAEPIGSPQGRLIFPSFENETQSTLMQFDWATHTTAPILRTPPNGLITGAVLAPDGTRWVVAYSPPAPPGEGQYYGRTNLYWLPSDCMNISTGCEVTALEPFLMRQNSVESIEHPAWSPDGEWLYYSYSHVTQTATQATFNRTLERINIKSGAIEAISADAIWPTVSANNGAIAFVKFASVLHQSAPNGTNLQTLLQAAPFVAIDAPTFTPDGRFIFFSAATSTTTPAWSLDLWFRPQVAEAHNYPSDWWRLDLETGTLQPISNLLLTQLNGDVSPDGQWLAFNSSVGVFNMQANGTALEQILRPNTVDTVLPLSLEWIP